MRLPQPGERFEGRYDITGLLGEGGFARVLRARDTRVGRDVALKITSPADGEYSVQIAQRFLREAAVIAELQDSHTITLYDFGESESGLLYMAFELVEGRDLSNILIQQGTLDAAAVVHVLRQTLSSLREAHERGILHRDIKPSNILMHEYAGDPYCVKLLDFGIAKHTDPSLPSITKTGTVVGTPRYMAPEQIFLEPLTAASDIYSLGLVAYEMLTGGPAHAGTSQKEIIKAAIAETPTLLPEQAAPASLRRVIERMVARQAADRYQRADAVIQALLTCEDELRAWRPSVRDAKPVEPAPLDLAATLRDPHVPVESRSNGLWLAMVGIVLFVAMAGVALAWVSTPDVAPQPKTKRLQPVLTRPATANAVPRVADLGADDSAVPPASQGCGRAAPFEGLRRIEKLDGLTSRSWRTYIPRKYDPQHAHPVIILFHGDASEPEMVFKQSELAALAEEHGIVVIAPHGKGILPWRTAESLERIPWLLARTSEQLCLDRDRVYTMGHGGGGHAVARLSCSGWVTAAATTNYRPERPDLPCEPKPPVPMIRFSPLDSKRFPADGEPGCGAMTVISLDAAEQQWRTTNRCEGKRREHVRDGRDVCWTWDCEVPLVSCHLRGGYGWPGSPHPEIDILGCETELTKLGATRAIWTFFSALPRMDRDRPAPW